MLIVSATVRAPAEEPLYQREPTDLVVLNEANNSAELELLPDVSRVIPNPLPRSGELRARLLDNPTNEVAISYSSIKRIERFPDRLLRVANNHVGKGEYGSAYDYFARLQRDYAGHPGLNTAFSEALQAEAKQRFQAGEQDHALALLGALAEQNPRARGLAELVDAIGDRMLQQRWDRQDYVGIRKTTQALEQQFNSVTLKVFDLWRERLQNASRVELKKAQQLAAAGRPREAIRAASGALALDETSFESRELVKRLMSQDRTLRIGVWRSASPDATVDLDTPAARRQARLLGGRLVTLDGYQATGGVYTPAVGDVDVDGQRRSVNLALSASSQQAAGLARLLLSRPESARAPLALLRVNAQRVSYEASGKVAVTLTSPHPRPASLLRDALPSELTALAQGAWERVAPLRDSGASARYRRRTGKGRFDAIEEYAYNDAEQAFKALGSQELHALDRVPPWLLSKLSAKPGLRLIPGRLPTVHCLLISPESPIRRRREARRAVVYAIPRQEVLLKEISGGINREGFAVLSAPVPLGVSLGDPLRYAYSDSVEPRPYDPRLATLLLTAARATDQARAEAVAAAAAAGEAAPAGANLAQIPDRIRLAHTATPVARRACAVIKQFLEAASLEVELVEADEAALSRGEVACDLRYAELTLGEPLADVWRLLGPGGLAGECSPPLLAALQQVTGAPNGKQAATELRDLHRVVFADLPVIPLLQTVDHIACLDRLVGLSAEPVDLYQGLDQWDLRMKEAP